jgi:hypothetical protein
MKYCLLTLVCASAGLAQQGTTTQTYTYNGMGERVAGPAVSTSVAGNTTLRTETHQSVNGRSVPAESVEERVVQDDGQSRVVERVIRRFDANGNPGLAEKIVIERRNGADGGTAVRTSVFRSDINGAMTLAERSATVSRESGNQVNIEETVDRPSINGSMETAERHETQVSRTADGETRNTAIFKRGENGGMYEAAKVVADTHNTPSGTVENVATYETASTGTMRLSEQTVRKTVKSADGVEHEVVDVYKLNVPGVANATGKPQLQEQQLIVRKTSGGGTSETVDVRRPSVSDPGRLSTPVRLKESVCTGNCK